MPGYKQCHTVVPYYLQNTSGNVQSQRLGQLQEPDPYSDTDGAGDREDDVGDDEGLDGEAALSDAEAEAEGHDCLVQHDGHEDGDEAARVVLEADGETVEDGVEGEGEEEHDGAEAGVLEDAVGDVVVAVVAVVGVVDLATDPHHHGSGLVAVVVVAVVVAVVGVAVVVVVVIPAVGAAEQGLGLALGSPLLLVVQHGLLHRQDQEETQHHDQLGQGEGD